MKLESSDDGIDQITLPSTTSSPKHPYTKSLLRWAGSKKYLLPHLIPAWKDNSKRLVEPFAGSAQFYFAIRPKKALLADTNADLVLALQCVKGDPIGISRRIGRMENNEDNYYRIRALDPSSLEPIARAARFIFLNRYCFNGLYRTNLRGEFNVPYGGQRSGNLPTIEALSKYSKLLATATIKNWEFKKTLSKCGPRDFVYIDPPYLEIKRRVFNSYSQNAFSGQDLVALREELVRLTKERVTWLMSYSDSDEGAYLAEGFSVKVVTVTRTIAGSIHKRHQHRELVVQSPSNS